MNATSMLLIIHWLLYNDYLNTYTYNSDTAVWVEFKAAAGGVLNIFANFTGKHLCWSLFFTKLQAFRPATLLKIDSYTSVFMWNFRNSKEHLFWGTPERLLLCIDYFIIYLFLQSSAVHVLHFYKKLLLYYAIKTIQLMTRFLLKRYFTEWNF